MATDFFLAPQRRHAVLTRLRHRGTVNVQELSDLLRISPSTVRRDLRELEEEGMLRRVHGGATVLDGAFEPDQPQRAATQWEEKGRIAEAALPLIRDHSTVLISGGTTTETLAARLGDRRGLTVVTNALPIAQVLSATAAVDVIVLGGVLRHREQSLLGHLAERALAELQIDQIFTSSFGLDAETGLTGAHVDEAQTDRALLAAARDIVVLADESKLGRRGPVRLARLEQVSTLVTDAGAAHPVCAALTRQGSKVVAA
ncbi:DeoR/GlpR family DNA-binding transcription regulator [Streptomyces sp. NEAU-H3]|uniref:DeoR/GlpR family DNA-binding transcription regulator n=1 Tax=Streptomyces sp. NEAU-H3 TaxID=2720636 RepID=UPI0014396005|nr:DeoR/GlpR family DNA-binding transcription regulator [Streptomyces sp. NEAU-H3]NJA58960.1 DeoR/GlpR transcriptional regulator [Streptomyces sp. NEAU-H3]